MSDTWQTIEQAAVTLGLSVRTVNRHITAGKLESRLFEGRREVRVTLAEPVTAPRGNGSVNGQTSSEPLGRATSSSGNAGSRGGDALTDIVAEATTPPDNSGSTINFVINAKPDGTREEGERRPGAEHPGQSTHHQHVTAEWVSDKPTDLQTMLALTDSIDDKATLAVSAYQTLARSAETQVQSLRKVAFGAWAVVGVMAVSIIVAVGWAVHRLTFAEVTASYLQDKVSKQDEELRRLSEDWKAEQKDMTTLRVQAATLEVENKALAEQAAHAKTALADERAASARLAASVVLGSATRPTTAPSNVASGSNGQSVSAAPATQPIIGAVPVGHASPPPGHPATAPAGKPGTPQNPRPTYFTNSNEAFDPK